MAENYGLPYAGSKSRIAHWVIDHLPRGRVLIDAIAYVIERRKEMGNPMFLEGKEVESVEDVLGTLCAGRLIGGWMNT